MLGRHRLCSNSASAVQVIVCASLILALIFSVFFPLSVFAQEEPQGVEGDRDSSEEIIDITADEIGYDRKNASATARGNVTVLFKSFRITGDYAEYSEGDPVVVIRGSARFEDTKEATVFTAEKIVFFLEEEELEAEGGVSLRYKDDQVLASGDKLSYFRRDKRAVIEGEACVEMDGKLIQASVITVFLDEERVLAEGGTRTVISRDESTP